MKSEAWIFIRVSFVKRKRNDIRLGVAFVALSVQYISLVWNKQMQNTTYEREKFTAIRIFDCLCAQGTYIIHQEILVTHDFIFKVYADFCWNQSNLNITFLSVDPMILDVLETHLIHKGS